MQNFQTILDYAGMKGIQVLSKASPSIVEDQGTIGQYLKRISNQGPDEAGGTEIIQPYNFSHCLEMVDKNPHHSTCVKAKRDHTVGQGFLSLKELSVIRGEIEGRPAVTGGILIDPQYATSEADEILSSLTRKGFQSIQKMACEDFMSTGNGYLEIVRRPKSMKRMRLAQTNEYVLMPNTNAAEDEITQICHMPSKETTIVTLSDGSGHYFRHQGAGSFVGLAKSFASFGETAMITNFLIKSSSKEAPTTTVQITPNHNNYTYSEVIHFGNWSSRNRWYGLPDWLACVGAFELSLLETQFKSDFFYNRGVPDYLISVVGSEISTSKWKELKDNLTSHIGPGNTNKSALLNIGDRDAKVDIHKLGLSSDTADTYAQNKESYALDIVTSHRVPPLLAGIMIPGKLGANNEFVNSMLSFQTSPISQYQQQWQQIYAATLGNEKLNGGLGLKGENFHMRRITDLFDLGNADTVSRMRKELPTAIAEGRDINDGLKD